MLCCDVCVCTPCRPLCCLKVIWQTSLLLPRSQAPQDHAKGKNKSPEEPQESGRSLVMTQIFQVLFCFSNFSLCGHMKFGKWTPPGESFLFCKMSGLEIQCFGIFWSTRVLEHWAGFLRTAQKSAKKVFLIQTLNRSLWSQTLETVRIKC